MEIQEPWFSLLLSQEKKVEGRKNSPKWTGLRANQKILVTCGQRTQLFLITAIRKYSTLQDYLEQEGLENCLPGITTIEEGMNIYRKWNTEEELAKYEFLAIEMKPSY